MASTTTPRKQRVVNVVDNRPLAREIGKRVRRMRLAAGMTQRQLAQPRYTAAYVSALENGLAKPSMAALHYLAGRLGVEIAAFLPSPSSHVSRLDADLRLAAGDHQAAIDTYEALLKVAASDRERADLLSRVAEALCRLRRGREALSPAGEAVALFERLSRDRDAAYARYWLAFAHHLADNPGEARNILRGVLAAVRDGLDVLPDFRFRVLVALGNVESWEGRYDEALAYLEEARGMAGDADDWRRASFLHNLSQTYAASGDDEAAYRTGSQALGIFQMIEARREVASLENSLAMTLVRLGSLTRAHEMADAARTHADTLPDTSFLAFVRETEAQIALAEGDLPRAHAHLDAAVEAAESTRNREALAATHRTRARALAAEGRPAEALSALERAAATYRQLSMPGRLRPVLSEWAELLSAEGRTAEALERYREALALGHGA